MARIKYQDDTQTLIETLELVGGGKRYEIHIQQKDEPEPYIIPVYASKKNHVPRMPIISWDAITWPCCNLENMWLLDADKQFWIRLGDDKWDKADSDYLLWLFADVFKDARNKVREVSGLELEK